MVNLKKEITIKTNDDKNIDPSLKEAMDFAKSILKKMQEEETLPTPDNFHSYFESMLSKAGANLQQQFASIPNVDTQSINEQHVANLEKEIKESFSSIKDIMQSVGGAYKNMNILKQLIKKTDEQLSLTSSQASHSKIIKSLKTDIDKFDQLIAQQVEQLKNHYEKTIVSLKSLDNKSIFDSRYEVYNKKHILKLIENEQKELAVKKHFSSVMAIKVKDELLNSILNARNQLNLNKNVGMLLQKTSRRSDSVGYFGTGIFLILMKHTNLEEAKLACQRVASLIYSSNFFVEGNDLVMNLEIAATDIDQARSVDEILVNIHEALPLSSRDALKYKIIDSQKPNDAE